MLMQVTLLPASICTRPVPRTALLELRRKVAAFLPKGPFQAPKKLRLHTKKKTKWSAFVAVPYPPAPNQPPELSSVKAYTKADLYPTEHDPRCYPFWALSPYWPVYVSNFRLNSLDVTERNAQIATFFACKGLLTRMIFIRDNGDQFFQNHQSKTLLLDMLVYFTCKEDADRAIRSCDRTSYYGHILNVFNGRIPVYMDPTRTVRFQIPQQYSVEHTETPTELEFRTKGSLCLAGRVARVIKHSECELFVEFEDAISMNYAVRGCTLWIPSKPTAPVRKQRFLEGDCKYDMMLLINQNPAFLHMLPPGNVLQALFQGKLPQVDKDWERYHSPRVLPDAIRESIVQEKIEMQQKMKEVNLAMGAPVSNVLEYKEMPLNISEEVTRQENIFFDLAMPPEVPQQPLMPQAMPAVDPDAAYYRMRESQQSSFESFESKLAMIRVKNPNADPTAARLIEERNYLSKLFKPGPGLPEKKLAQLKQEFMAKKKKLLANTGEPLAARNKLFFALLRLEKTLGGMDSKGAILEDELRTGLTATIYNMGLQQDFSMSKKHADLSAILNPLDKLWPVFVGNFSASDPNPKQRNQQIRELFASQGLPVYMIYHDERDEFYNRYLKPVKLMDMLVYFSEEELAVLAIKRFHRFTHLGYKLNVFPGREKDFCVPDRTVFLELDDDPAVAESSIQQFLSTVRLPLKDLNSTMRCHGRAIFLFTMKHQGRDVIRLAPSAKLVEKPAPMKQRYIEADVKADLLRRILHDADFFQEQPTAPSELKRLFAVKSLPSEETGGEIVWADDEEYQKRKVLNDRIGEVLEEWKKLQTS